MTAGASSDARSTDNLPPVAELFPNPAYGETFQIATTVPDVQVAVFDASGRMRISQTLGAPGAHPINASDLSHGLYFVRLNAPDGRISTLKIILAR